MLARRNLIDLFSTFIQFSDDKFSNWITDFKLKKSINSYLKKESDKEILEKFLSLFWYHKWCKDRDSLAKNHLLAYFQEPCYWASQKIVSKFPYLQYKLSDCFQMAIAQFEQVLATYNLDYGSSLSSYATLAFRSIINNLLRQKSATDICTDWALLRKISKKRLIASLENAGFNQAKIDLYCLVWTCFQNIYVPKQQKLSQKLSAPDLETWNKIVLAYQQQVINYPEVKAENSNLNAQNLEKVLLRLAKLIRQYLYPQTISLNIAPAADDSGELLDIIATNDLSPLEEIIKVEEINTREKKYNQISQVLTKALNQLQPEIKLILELYYQENYTQQEIAKRLETKQYTVSRRVTRARELLLKALIKWSQDNLQITIDSEKLREMSIVLEEWITNYYNRE